jgi:hypothetical protein
MSVLMRLRIPEVDQHPIAHVLRDEASEALHGLGNTLLVGRNDLAEVFRVHAGRYITVTWRRSAVSCGAIGAMSSMEGLRVPSSPPFSSVIARSN